MFESIQFHPLGNPAADAVGDMGNMIMQARQQQRAAEIERAKMLMQQGNIDADNRRADAQMSLQRQQFERTGQTQDEERMRQGAQDFAKIYESAGKDPQFARQLAKAHGYEIIDTPSGPKAFKADAPPPNAAAAPPQAAPVDAVSGGAPTPGVGPGPNAQWVGGPEGKWVPRPELNGRPPTEPQPFEPQRQVAPSPQAAPGLAGKFGITGKYPGQLEAGNVDLTNRPDVANADGSHSSVRSMSFEENGKEILVPTVSEDGRIMSDDEAIAQYHRTGKHLGKFATPDAATAYASALHNQQESQMTPQQRGAPEAPPATAAENFMARFGIRRKGGPTLDVDPAAAKAADEAKFAEALKLKNAAPEARILAMQEDHERARAFKEAEDAKYRETHSGRVELANIGASGRVSAARASTAAPLKVDAGNRQDMGTLERTYKDWITANQLNIDSKTAKRLVTADANLKGNSIQQREAAESLVSIFKGGGQVTKASQELLLKHLAGVVGDAQTFVEHLKTGRYGANELAILKEAAANALAEQKEKIDTYQQSAVDTFGPGSGFENLGGNVNHKLRGFFRQFGVEMPDIYKDAPQVTLGSGQRPKPVKPANPIVNAAKVQSLAPVDKQLVQQAKDEIAKGGQNAASAKAYLQHLGM